MSDHQRADMTDEFKSAFGDMRMTDCDHRYERAGLVYEHEHYSMPGTGAKARHYFDWFFCSKCLTYRYTNERVIGTSYEKPVEGAVPR